MELTDLTLHELQAHLAEKKISAVELTRNYLERISAIDEKLNVFIHVAEEKALQAAEKADRRLRTGAGASLTGIPIGLKDLFVTEGIETTCASKILSGFKPPYDGTVVKRLKDQDAVIIGKLNMDEFAMGSSNETSVFGPVRNPWHTEYVAGGSSGGSAACVAARMATAALGSDTGGSIRQPASHCGVVGLKPTYGRVSRYGVVAFASSLDQVGPLASDIEDCAILLQAVAGYDPLDSTSIDTPVPNYPLEIKKGIEGLKIGRPKEYFIDGLDPDVRSAIEKALETYRQLGAEIIDVSLPHTDYATACFYLIATAEASSNLARYDGVRFGQRVDPGEGLLEMYRQSRAAGFGTEVKRRIMLGTFALSSGYYDAYYLNAQKVRTLIRRDMSEAFEKVDVLLTPVAPTPAFRIGEKTADPLPMYLSDIFTIPVNLAGTCGLSLPCGQSREGLPIGLQLIGKPFAEDLILRAGYAFEQATEWHRRKVNP